MKYKPFQSLQFRLQGPLVVLLLVFMLLFGYFSWVFHSQYSQLSKKISINSEVGRHAVEVTRIRAKIQQILFAAGSGNSVDFEDELSALNAARSSHLERIRALTKDNKRWRLLGASTAGGIEDASFLQVEMVNAAKAKDKKRAALALRQLSTIFDINSSRLKDFTLHLENDLQENAKDLQSLLQKTFWIFFVLGGALAFSLWLIGRLYRLHVLTPLQLLHRGLQSLLKGDMDSHIREVPAPSELREMTFDFNKMVTALKTTQDDLTEAREDALAAAKIKSEFLANMSHEIRTPLNTIVGITDELMEMDLKSTQKEYTQILSKSSQVLLSIVNDILDFSKLEDGSISLDEKPVDLKELTERICTVVEPIARKKGLEFNCKVIPDSSCWVLADSKRLEQIMLNLLGNAIKFTETGKVEIQIESNCTGNNKNIGLTVTDTGAGIPESDLSNIFERFIQSDTSVTRKYGGTGLGLSIVKQLVNLMHGEITVKSQLGKGSQFRVELKLAEAVPQVSRKQEPQEAVKQDDTTKKSILLVDDSVDNRTLIQIYLKNLPYEITIAKNGQEAVDEFKSKKFDLILMDMQMPVMDGYEATKQIRKLESANALSKTRIIGLSAYSMKEEIERGRQAGCDDYLTKPIRKPDLMSVIQARI
jgi:signal transduction histidine kinase/ActR/RegA family two-component response regulator